METPKLFYRYTSYETASMGIDGEYTSSPFPNPRLRVEEYNLHKETPKGYWIGYGKLDELHSPSRWVSKDGKKRFAYPTKEEALTNFIKRNERRVKILKRQVMSCEIAIRLAEKLFAEKV
jgi:hypothetical protein